MIRDGNILVVDIFTVRFLPFYFSQVANCLSLSKHAFHFLWSPQQIEKILNKNFEKFGEI